MAQDGRPLVLLHGLSGSWRWWRRLLPLLDGRELVLLDLPRSLAPRHAAAWVAGRIPADSDLAGYSMGGLIAAQLAARRPDLVRRLVLVAPAGAPAPRSLPAYALGLARTAATSPLDLVRTIAFDALRTGPLALARGSWFATHTAFAGDIEAPTLLVWGARDALLPVELAAEWHRVVPRARLAVVPSVGHVPMWEAPSAVAKLVLEFLDEPGDDVGVGPVDGVGGAWDDDEPSAGDGG